MKFRLSLMLVVSVFTGSVLAKPEVLADFGGRATDFPTRDTVKKTLTQQAQLMGQPKPLYPLPSPYPVRSNLTVGIVEPYAHNTPVTRPVFILGSDDLSTEWLIKNRSHLASIKALGMVTNVESREAIERIQSLVPELAFVAVPVDEFIRLFRLTHYPVLIDQEGVKQ
jgi:integrating conjugative element protein (TIGR03765 family)